MKKDKLMYNPPVVEPLVIRFEGNLLVTSPGDNEGFKTDSSPYTGGWDDEED